MNRFLIFAFGALALLSACAGAPSTATLTIDETAPETQADPPETTQTQVPSAPETENTSAGDADVEFVRAVLGDQGTWTFHVTVSHADTGWEDYADGWDVLLPDGTVLKSDPGDPFTRLLLHPHETEQPFTRSQSGLVIPAGVTHVTVRAHDLVDGFGGQTIVVDLTLPEGPGFEVER